VKELLAEQKITFSVSNSAKDILAKEGYDPNFGARPLRRTIERVVENPISEKILSGELKDGEHLFIGAKKDKIIFEKKEPKDSHKEKEKYQDNSDSE
jgi:ATP-dependent Clp protease ATP-binding subunit ClpC